MNKIPVQLVQNIKIERIESVVDVMTPWKPTPLRLFMSSKDDLDEVLRGCQAMFGATSFGAGLLLQKGPQGVFIPQSLLIVTFSDSVIARPTLVQPDPYK